METKVHIGSMLSHRIEALRVKRTQLGIQMGLSETAVYAYEKRSSLHVHSLLKLCHGLRYNFFKDIALRLPTDYASAADTPQDKLLAEQAEQIKKLQWENDLLKELISRKG
ncbi:hypothetical protein F0919_01100 [Taibaiella lutea]|uniref:HTH cro/C1-type domain-containing protein n=1 Tax=Taibaiella lutea TaxID=2608001 RepID=A0A5M6CMD3_9BACT|nr:hypothetical protein [Taibaiella lutea]KAA5536294.1 hypothetical protein F0919_01100 [Taibaiella lutea]